MKFVKLDHQVLLSLKEQGYNVLTSVNTVDDDNPTYMPQKVGNLWDYLEGVPSVPMQERALLVIDDAMQNIREEDLKGSVWV